MIQTWAIRWSVWSELEECGNWGGKDYIEQIKSKDIDLPYGIT